MLSTKNKSSIVKKNSKLTLRSLYKTPNYTREAKLVFKQII